MCKRHAHLSTSRVSVLECDVTMNQVRDTIANKIAAITVRISEKRTFAKLFNKSRKDDSNFLTENIWDAKCATVFSVRFSALSKIIFNYFINSQFKYIIFDCLLNSLYKYIVFDCLSSSQILTHYF